MLEHTIRKLQERIRQSRLKDVLTEELRDLLSNIPQGVRTDEYITATAVLILKELKSELLKNDDGSMRPQPPCGGGHGLDCETIINGLLIGMHRDLLESNLQMVKALGSAVAERDYGTSEHNLRVTLFAVKLGETAGLEKDQITALIKGSFLHDVGKIGIRDDTLLKPSSLSKKEYEDVKQHVILGKRIVRNVRWLEDAVDILLYHHENFDGSGYPSGLKGEKIPLLARVFCIADVFDALTSTRPYKPALTYDDTLTEITEKDCHRFDPRLVEYFKDVSRELYDSIVPLSTAELEENLLEVINRYFRFSPTIDDLRDSFGTMTRSGSGGEN